MELADAVAVLLALPGVSEADHHGRRSFRIGGGKVVATVWADGVLNLLVGEDVARSVAGSPGVELLPWGRRVAGVQVTLSDVDPALVAALAEAAWARRAPASAQRRRRDGADDGTGP